MSSLQVLLEIERKVRQNLIAYEQGVDEIIEKVNRDDLYAFYCGNSPEFEKACVEEDDNWLWDLVEAAADKLEL